MDEHNTAVVSMVIPEDLYGEASVIGRCSVRLAGALLRTHPLMLHAHGEFFRRLTVRAVVTDASQVLPVC